MLTCASLTDPDDAVDVPCDPSCVDTPTRPLVLVLPLTLVLAPVTDPPALTSALDDDTDPVLTDPRELWKPLDPLEDPREFVLRMLDEPCDVPKVLRDPCDVPRVLKDPCDVPWLLKDPRESVPRVLNDPCGVPCVLRDPCDVPEVLNDPCDVPCVLRDPCDDPRVLNDPREPVPKVLNDPCDAPWEEEIGPLDREESEAVLLREPREPEVDPPTLELDVAPEAGSVDPRIVLEKLPLTPVEEEEEEEEKEEEAESFSPRREVERLLKGCTPLPSLTSPPTRTTPAENPGILKGTLVVCRETGWREVDAAWVLGRGLENACDGAAWVEVKRGDVVGLPGWRVEKLAWLVGRSGCLVVMVDGCEGGKAEGWLAGNDGCLVMIVVGCVGCLVGTGTMEETPVPNSRPVSAVESPDTLLMLTPTLLLPPLAPATLPAPSLCEGVKEAAAEPGDGPPSTLFASTKAPPLKRDEPASPVVLPVVDRTPSREGLPEEPRTPPVPEKEEEEPEKKDAEEEEVEGAKDEEESKEDEEGEEVKDEDPKEVEEDPKEDSWVKEEEEPREEGGVTDEESVLALLSVPREREF
ncbi:Leucine-rich repeat and coiled-coil domain-containing protein [Portunus trituberculatus]|uniref:Leucine-rich repeat and coiled-coil domain-containing protein n=1 Tax=Portunus trituberculatus TaxID=210409 RepID=A0A5B7EMS1_PORTR|nr:Leucine-rich repeat and coiled-coil domain-containing protein [Portunus trituberculatus]